MPRTVPDVGTATPNVFKVAVKYIDATGDHRSISMSFPSAPSFINLEALIAALAVSQNANIYEVVYENIWQSADDVSDATNATRASVSQVIHAVAKNAAGDAIDTYFPAPIEASFLANSDTPDAAAVALAASLAAWVNLLPIGYSLNSLRFAGHIEKNKKVLV